MSTRKYARVEKATNGYVIRIGGPGSGEKVEQWVAASLDDVMRILAEILDGKTMSEGEGS